MMIIGDENTNLAAIKEMMIRSFNSNTIHEEKEVVSPTEDSEDTFKDALLDGTDIFICLILSKAGVPKEEAMSRYNAVPETVKLRIGEILLQTTHNLLSSKNTWR